MSGVRVVGIVGSPRKCGDRELLMRRALEIIAAEGLPAELIPLAGKSIGPCPPGLAHDRSPHLGGAPLNPFERFTAFHACGSAEGN